MGRRGDAGRPVDVEPDEPGGRAEASPAWRPIRTLTSTPGGHGSAASARWPRRPPARPRARCRRRRRTSRPRCPPRARRASRTPRAGSRPGAPGRAVYASLPSESSRRVEPSMSENRKVRVAAGGPRPSGGRGLSAGSSPSPRAGGVATPRRIERVSAGCSSRIRSKSHEASARQLVGSSAVTVALRGIRSRTDSSPKNSPGPSRATTSPSRTTRTMPAIDDEEARADLALPGDHVAGREVDRGRESARAREAVRVDAV